MKTPDQQNHSNHKIITSMLEGSRCTIVLCLFIILCIVVFFVYAIQNTKKVLTNRKKKYLSYFICQLPYKLQKIICGQSINKISLTYYQESFLRQRSREMEMAKWFCYIYFYLKSNGFFSVEMLERASAIRGRGYVRSYLVAALLQY